MRSYRSVDPTRSALGAAAYDFLIKRLAHPVEALKLILARAEILPGHRIDRGQRVRVMRGELWEDSIRRGQQPTDASEVRNIGVDLAGVYRKTFQPIDLRALDLAVPISSLHEPNHDAMAGSSPEVDEIVNDGRCTLLVGLHHEADSIPSREFGVD